MPRKNKKMIIILIGGVIFMFAFSYMLVPIYNLVCNETGLNGRSANSAAVLASGMHTDTSRTVTVGFSTTIHDKLNFKFIPLQRHITIHPGEVKLIYFYAQNQTGHEITVQAVPSITPNEAAKYLKKTQCFCFTQQYFFKNEKADMPVYFFVDTELPKNIKEVTLSYTLFDATPFLKKNQKHFIKGRIDV